MIRETDLTRELAPREVARLLGVSTKTLSLWRREGRGPRCARYGVKTVRYELSDLEAWRKSCRDQEVAA